MQRTCIPAPSWRSEVRPLPPPGRRPRAGRARARAAAARPRRPSEPRVLRPRRGCGCCPPHPSAPCAETASPIYASPDLRAARKLADVRARPIYASPMYAHVRSYASRRCTRSPDVCVADVRQPDLRECARTSSARPAPAGAPLGAILGTEARRRRVGSATVIVLDTGLAEEPFTPARAGGTHVDPGRLGGRRRPARRERRRPSSIPPPVTARSSPASSTRSRRAATSLSTGCCRPSVTATRRRSSTACDGLVHRRPVPHHPQPLVRRLRARAPVRAGPGHPPPAGHRGRGGVLGRQRRHLPAHLPGRAARRRRRGRDRAQEDRRRSPTTARGCEPARPASIC